MWQVTPDGGWQFSLSRVNVDRLTANRELVARCHRRRANVVEQLQPSGSIRSVQQQLEFCETATIGTVDGGLGREPRMSAGGDSRSHADTGHQWRRPTHRPQRRTAPRTAPAKLALDSLIWKDVQLTNVRGPFWVDSVALPARRAGVPAAESTAATDDGRRLWRQPGDEHRIAARHEPELQARSAPGRR